jgi:F-type H+-transporting ATPase subunit delta
MALFSSVLDQNKSLGEFLANPIFSQTAKKAVVESILEKIQVSPHTANFLRLLVDKERIDLLANIEKSYRDLTDDALKKVRVTVKTAFPLTGETSSRLKAGLETMTGKAVEMTVQEDSALIGGIMVRVGDTLYDGSIRTQLNNMRHLIGEDYNA